MQPLSYFANLRQISKVMQIAPSPALSDIVKHFLIIESAQTGCIKHRMFSDGNPGLVFNLGDALIQIDPRQNTAIILPDSFVYGQLDVFQTILSKGKINLLIAVLHPFGASALLKTPANRLRNLILDSALFYTSRISSIVDELSTAPTTISKVDILQRFLNNEVKSRAENFAIACNAVSLIQRELGILPVQQIYTTLNITERKLERVFEEHIGLSPKRFSGVTRMQHFLKLLRKKTPDISLTELTYTCGFYDQAHVIRELKNISGITPGQYLTQPNLLAANLILAPQ